MKWSTSVRLHEIARSSFWVFAVPGFALGIITSFVLIRLDRNYGWALLELTPGGAQAFLASSVATLTSLLAIAFSVVVLIVQLAAGQLSPRVVKPALGGIYAKAILTLAVFSLAYTLGVLLRSGKEDAPQLSVIISVPLVIGSLIGFVGFLDRVGRGTRHAYIIEGITHLTARSIVRAYPQKETAQGAGPAERIVPRDGPPLIVPYHGRPGLVQAYHLEGLASLAKQYRVHIQVQRAIGDYVYDGMDLFHVYGAAPDAEIPHLDDAVVVGAERSLAFDPAYGFRLLVDIAIKALSPAINDPTTALAVLDAEQYLLMLLSRRELSRHSFSRRGVRVPMPSWDSYVELALTEIRSFADSSVTVWRRMRATLDELASVVDADQRVALERQRTLLDQAVKVAIASPAEQAMALKADHKGLG